MPAALRSIEALARGGVYPQSDWAESAGEYAQVWEDETLEFFEVSLHGTAKLLRDNRLKRALPL